MMPSNASAYPLRWPDGWARTRNRTESAFRSRTNPANVRDECFHELKLLGASDVILSSNVPVRGDGMPYAEGLSECLADPGVAIYFTRGGKSQVIACDKYRRPVENLRALSLTLDAMRAIHRYGSSEILNRAFTGFTALPPAMKDRHWSDVLGVPRDASISEIQRAYREGAKRFHPDAGGDAETFQHIARAWEQARQERGEKSA